MMGGFTTVFVIFLTILVFIFAVRMLFGAEDDDSLSVGALQINRLSEKTVGGGILVKSRLLMGGDAPEIAVPDSLKLKMSNRSSSATTFEYDNGTSLDDTSRTKIMELRPDVKNASSKVEVFGDMSIRKALTLESSVLPLDGSSVDIGRASNSFDNLYSKSLHGLPVVAADARVVSGTDFTLKSGDRLVYLNSTNNYTVNLPDLKSYSGGVIKLVDKSSTFRTVILKSATSGVDIVHVGSSLAGLTKDLLLVVTPIRNADGSKICWMVEANQAP